MNIRALSIFALCFCLVLAFSGQSINQILAQTEASETSEKDKEIAKGFYNLADEAFKSKSYQQAIEQFTKALKYYPDFIEAIYKMGETYEKMENEVKSLQCYTKCNDQLNAKAELSEGEAKIKTAIESKLKVLEAFEAEVNKCDNEITERLLSLGPKAIEGGDYVLGAEIFSLILIISPDYAEAENYLKKIVKAEKEEMPKASNKELEELYYNLGVKSLDKKEYEKARENLEKALEQAETPINIYIKLAETYEKLGNQPKTVKYYHIVIRHFRLKELSVEENKLLQQANQAMKKMDSIGQELSKVKTMYAGKLTQIGNTWLGKKYRNFAAIAFTRLLVVEPDNKKAKEMLQKCNVEIITPISKGAKGAYPNFSNGGGGNWANGYCKTVSINNLTGTHLIDYQIKITLTTDTLGSSYNNIKPDGSDLRFTQTVEGKELPYWIESFNNKGDSNIWVKVPRVPNSKSKIYMYYGNPSASSGANGNNTFDFFDDFSAGFDESRWDRNQEGSENTCGAFVRDGVLHVYGGDTNAPGWARSKTSLSNKLVLESKIKVFHANNNTAGGFVISDDPNITDYGAGIAGIDYIYWIPNDGLIWAQNHNSFAPLPVTTGIKLPVYWRNTWFRQKLYYDGTKNQNNVRYIRDKGQGEEEITHSALTAKPQMKILFQPWAWWFGKDPTNKFYIDWIFVRKYGFPDPTATIGTD
jgi:tetratricopeptide (TPR) repeat protein